MIKESIFMRRVIFILAVPFMVTILEMDASLGKKAKKDLKDHLNMISTQLLMILRVIFITNNLDIRRKASSTQDIGKKRREERVKANTLIQMETHTLVLGRRTKETGKVNYST